MSIMSLGWFILSMIVCRSSVIASINHIRFPDKEETICVYLFEPTPMNVSEVKFTMTQQFSVCQFDERIFPRPSINAKEILIIQFSANCSLIQQLIVLNNITWIHQYFGVLFSIHRIDKSFEQTLLSYFRNPTRSPSLSSSRIDRTIIGFIDAEEVNRLNDLLSNRSNPSLSPIHREYRQFDPVIFLILGLILICILLGNAWHRRVFLNKVLNHYQNHTKESMKLHMGLIIGLLLFIALALLYLFDRYLASIIIGFYLDGFLIFSALILYLFLNHFSYLFFKMFKKTDVQSDQNYVLFPWILLFASFLLTLVWFFNRFTSTGFVLSNCITCAMTILIIAQMRIANLTICIMIYVFLVLFESLSLLVLGFQERCQSHMSIAHLTSSIRAWTTNENEIDIQRLYSKLLDNSGYDCWLSGGTMNALRRNAMPWIIKEGFPLVFRFPRFTRDADGCGFSTSRIYFAVDDLIFPSLLINFCRLFDIGNHIPYRIYYIQALVSYLLSVLLSNLIMFISHYDQLSSMIIYPCLITSTLITGAIRGELGTLFQGRLPAFERRPTRVRSNSF